MPFSAGEIGLASKFNRIQPTTYDVAATTAPVTLTTSNQDVTGATITFSTTAANAIYVATACFDFEATTAAVTVMQGRLSVDAAVQTEEALLDGSISSDQRATVYQQWRGTLASSGSHTIKLVALKSLNVGVMRVNHIHTTLTVVIYEVV